MTDTTNPGNNTPDVNTDTTDEQVEKPSYLTAEQFNKALTARERAFEKRIAKMQEDHNKVIERLAPPPKDEPALSRTAELEKNVKELSRIIQERDAGDKARELRSSTERSLLAHGIEADYRDHALAYLIDYKKAVKRDGDGNIVFVLNGVEYDDLDAGLAIWANSKDARAYKKGSGALGSGETSRKNSASEVMKQTGALDLKYKDKWQESNDKKLSLTKDSKVALQQLLGSKLNKQ